MAISYAVNKRLLPVKLSYYFTLAGIACLLPYLSVYMKQLGLSPSETAIIYGTMPFLGAFVRPIVGMIADKLHKHKLILMMCCVVSGLFHGALFFIPGVPGSTAPQGTSVASMVCDRDSSVLQYCADIRLTERFLDTCPAGVFNRSDVLDTFDPLRNKSLCSLQCEMSALQNHSSLCFAPEASTDEVTANRRDCSHNVGEGEGDDVQLEFVRDSINHSLSYQRYHPHNLTWNVCQTYSMSTFYFNGTSYQKLYCLEPTSLQCELRCSNGDTGENSVAKQYTNQLGCEYQQQTDTSTSFSKTFWLFLILNFIANVAFAPIFSLIDAMAYDFLGEDRGKWGQQRMWGTIGYAMFGVTAGLLMDIYTTKEQSQDSNADDIFTVDYTLAFVMFVVLQFAVTIVVSRYKTTDTLTCAQMFNNIWTLLRKIEVSTILLLVFIFGALTGVMETFVFWHLQTLGASQLLLGLCTTISCLPEIPILFLSGWIIERLGHVVCLCMVCVAYSIRFICYSLLTSPWPVLGIEPLQGITFGLMYASASSYGSLVTPNGMHGTVQGLIGGVHFGFGRGFGSLVGGQVFQAYGAVTTFRSCAIVALCTLVIYLLIQLYIKKFKSQEASATSDGANGDAGDPLRKTHRHTSGTEDESSALDIKRDSIIA